MDERILNKYIAGDALPDEKEQVIRWMKESDANRRQLAELHKIYDAVIWHHRSAEKQPPKQHRTTRKHLRRAIQVAAMIGMLAFIAYKEYREYSMAHSPQMQTMIVPEGQRACLVLADGSKVWLNSNSRLRYPAAGFPLKERKVELDGEGYFEVATDRRHPFVVQTEKYDVRVEGTTFNVHAYSRSGLFETALVEGKVTVCPSGTPTGITLAANERAIEREGQLQKTAVPSDEIYLWKDGIYAFSDETLENIFKKISTYYDVKVVNTNKEIASRKCTGKFRQKEGVWQTMRVLQKYVRFDYTYEEEKNLITVY